MLGFFRSCNLTLTLDCGHSLRFTPAEEGGWGGSWGLDFHVAGVTQRSPATCRHGDRSWMRQEVNTRVWPVCSHSSLWKR